MFKRIFLTFCVFAGVLTQSMLAQEIVGSDLKVNLKTVSFDNPEYQWSEYDEKRSSALIKDDCLLINAKKENAVSYVDLPIDVSETNFVVNLFFTPDKLGNNPCGIVFNVEDNQNFNMIILEKKQFSVATMKDGKVSINRKGIYKLSKGMADLNGLKAPYIKKAKDVIVISLQHKGQSLGIELNGMDLASVRKIDLEFPVFGFIAFKGNKVKAYGLSYGIEDKNDYELSTTE